MRLAPLLALALSACGPALREAPQPTAYLAADAVCSAGPLEFHATLEGAQWGEYVRLRVDSPRALVGLARVLVDGRVVDAQSRWHTVTEAPDGKGSTHRVRDVAPHNQRCLAPTPSAAAAAPHAARWPDVPPDAAPGPTSPLADEGEWQPLPARSLAFGVEAPHGPLRPASAPSVGLHFGYVAELGRKNEDRRRDPPFREGARVVIQVYSEAPNDFAGVVFTLEQGRWAPDVDAASWQAELERREANERRAAHYQVADARRRARAAQRRAEEANRAEQERRAHCAAHPDDDDCRPRPVTPPSAPRAARSAPQAVARAPAPAAPAPPPQPPQPREPDGPPPPAPAEPTPPAPASYVEWVPGTWWWTGFAWQWLPGWWRVDEARRRAVERAAAQPCPAPRPEAPPSQRVEGATWRAGAWVWGTLSWVWLPGGWVRPTDVHPAVPVKR